MAHSPFPRPQSMEIEAMCYILPAPAELEKVEEAATGLLDLAGVEKGEVATPTTLEEALNLGPELRRRGSELVLGIEGDMRVRRMVELKTCVLARIKARAAAASSTSGLQNSELIRLVKFVGVDKVDAQYVSKCEQELMLKVLTQFPAPTIGLQARWIPGAAPDAPGCNCKGSNAVKNCSVQLLAATCATAVSLDYAGNVDVEEVQEVGFCTCRK